jgi:hypothetical protein
MELDFDDLDIPISDAHLYHLSSPTVSSSKGFNLGGGSGAEDDARSSFVGKGARSNVLDHTGEVDEVDGFGTTGTSVGMMDWQSIDPGGEYARLSTHLVGTR